MDSNRNPGANALKGENEQNAVREIERNTAHRRIFATGLRSPVGLLSYPVHWWIAVSRRAPRDDVDGLAQDDLLGVRGVQMSSAR